MEHRVRTCSPLDAIGFNLSRSPQTSHPALFFSKDRHFFSSKSFGKCSHNRNKRVSGHTHTHTPDRKIIDNGE